MFYTKPRVTVYIDDKAVGYKDWKTSIKEVKPNLIYEIKYSGLELEAMHQETILNL